ncbi:glycosyltransferase family 61 protein [Methylobacterium sp. 13MFTsu3.1M2]|uniref:glycosyltransferase family 61 protein n=1 Tax=Methylobacterium sp. 13MFTsu3.1M2 TaxID=1502776 RepID=UPI0008E0C3FD|nr:glycosyltransferase family 61 protein [Methylobacterium sp. 13MFTsu3.1M2]SFF18421.1 Capsular polysaccharide biosynthesis protein [Methylobacterium sp. 13MFTsu3.1M2]
MSDFLDLIRDHRGGQADLIARLGALAADPAAAGTSPGTMIRHLDALAFRLDGGGAPDLAAQAYDLAAILAGRDGGRWALAAAEARLRDLCARGRFAEADPVVARLRAADANRLRPRIMEELIDRAWLLELRGEAEASVQFYCLALDLNGGAPGLVSRDGDPLAKKIKNLRRLQLDALIEAGEFDAAVALHETTRRLIGAGPLACYDMVAAASLAGRPGIDYAELRPPRPIQAPELKFTEPPPPLTSEPGDLEAPSQYLAFVDGCHAFPRSNLVVKDGHLIYDLAAHPRRRDVLLQDGVNPDQIVMAAFGERRALVEIPEDSLSIEAGLSMFGLQSRNYGHWFCEFVPRMLAYNDPRCPDGIPLCIDDHMPATHEEVVRLLDTRDRPIIKLPPRPVAFGRLGLAPVPAFFPFEMRPGQPVYDTIWPADILVDLRTRILDSARARGALSGRTGRRLFISRKAFAQRQLVNEVEIAEALRPHGFEVITPETMTFLEQVDAFHAADIIVGSSSSALTNGLFCRPDCRILGLIHANLSFNFRGYTSFIEAGGARITFLRGQTTNEDGHAFHASYHVAPSAVVAALRSLAQPTPVLSPQVPPVAPAVAGRSVVGRLLSALPFPRRADGQ